MISGKTDESRRFPFTPVPSPSVRRVAAGRGEGGLRQT